MQEPTVPVTGVARGGLGTATNLDDTQVYSLEELRQPVAEPIEYEPAAPAAPARAEPAPAAVPLERARVTTSARSRRADKSSSGTRRVGPIVVGALAALALAAVLTLQDAPTAGPGGLGGGVTGAGSDSETSAPLATTAPEPTAVPEGGGGKDNGKGNGHGKGGGNGND